MRQLRAVWTRFSITVLILGIFFGAFSCRHVTSQNSSLRAGESPEDPDKGRRIFGNIVAIKALLPDIFRRAAIYDVDLYTLLLKQEELLKQLSTVDGYDLETSNRAPLLALKLNILSQTEIITRRIDPKRIGEWRNSLKNALTTVAESPEDMNLAILQKIADVGSSAAGAAGLSTALVNLLPPEKRQELFRMSSSDRLAKLRTELKETTLPGSFQPRKVGINSDRITKDQALNILQQRFSDETLLRDLMMLHITLQATDGEVSLSAEEISKFIFEAGERELDILLDTELFKKRVNVIENEIKSISKTDIAKLRGSGESSIRRLVGDISESTIEVKSAAANTLYLQEVPPILAYLRGLIGGDCSSEYSPGYSNSPNERTFFIIDPKGEPKGYVSVTKTILNGKPNLYIHTISGKRLTAADATVVLTGIIQNLSRFGAKTATLPTASQLRSLVNYIEIRETFNEVSKTSGNKVVEQNYSDAKFREVIGKASAISKYDNPQANQQVILFEKLPGNVQVETSEVSSQYTGFKPIELTLESAIHLAMELVNRWNHHALERLSEIQWHDKHRLNELQKDLRNAEHLPEAEYREKLTKTIGDIGGIFADADWKQSPHLFLLGLLRAKDAFFPQNIDLTRKRFFELLEINEPQAFVLVKTLEKTDLIKLIDHPETYRFIERANFGLVATPGQLVIILRATQYLPAIQQAIEKKIETLHLSEHELNGVLYLFEDLYQYAGRTPPPQAMEIILNAFFNSTESQANASSLLQSLGKYLSGSQVERLFNRYNELPDTLQHALLTQLEQHVKRLPEHVVREILEDAMRSAVPAIQFTALAVLTDIKSGGPIVREELRRIILQQYDNQFLFMASLLAAKKNIGIEPDIAQHLVKLFPSMNIENQGYILLAMNEFSSPLPEFDAILTNISLGNGIAHDRKAEGLRTLALEILARRISGSRELKEIAFAILRSDLPHFPHGNPDIELKTKALTILQQDAATDGKFAEAITIMLEKGEPIAKQVLDNITIDAYPLTDAQMARLQRISGENKELAERIIAQRASETVQQTSDSLVTPINCTLLSAKYRKPTARLP